MSEKGMAIVLRLVGAPEGETAGGKYQERQRDKGTKSSEGTS